MMFKRLIKPGHEYTTGNVKFARSVDQSPEVEKLEKYAKENEVTTGKFSIADEVRSQLTLLIS